MEYISQSVELPNRLEPFSNHKCPIIIKGNHNGGSPMGISTDLLNFPPLRGIVYETPEYL